ncbi:hypothetical protein MMC30_005614 [Trapelia coarctata]|nr:hypothetical protein [Trapelia coarctata]
MPVLPPPPASAPPVDHLTITTQIPLRSSKLPRVICYHQTHYHNNLFVSALPLLDTGITHLIIAAFHVNAPDDKTPKANITLNNDPPDHHKLAPLWTEIRAFQHAGVKVLGMLGGAAQGSFTRLDGDAESFETYYQLLYKTLEWAKLDGLDLDVEEEMCLAGIIRLIGRLKRDFGDEFLITLAPVAPALRGSHNLSGFSYEDLEKAFGRHIAWYNTQFYCGWGDMTTTADYESIVDRGWLLQKIVVGLVTNPENGRGWVSDGPLGETLGMLKAYPGFGGVMGWEYFNSMTEGGGQGEPWCWAQFMTDVLHAEEVEEDAAEVDRAIM